MAVCLLTLIAAGIYFQVNKIYYIDDVYRYDETGQYMNSYIAFFLALVVGWIWLVTEQHDREQRKRSRDNNS